MINANSIKKRLKNIAVKQNKQFDYLLMLYMVERFLYRISVSDYSDLFILKGGLLLYTILEDKGRVTKDIDFLALNKNNSQDEIVKVFNDLCMIECDDALIFDSESIGAQIIREGAAYEGIRVKLTAYLDNSRKVLQFDIGFGDVVVPHPVVLEYPVLLDMARPKLKVYSLESIIAEKFEAMIYLADINSRMKDFYDIYYILGKFNISNARLYQAIKETFKRRKTPMMETPVVLSGDHKFIDNKQIQWNAFLKRIQSEMDVEFSDIIERIIEILGPIYKKIYDENHID